MVKIAAWENGIELYQLLSGIEYATVKTMEEAKARPMFVSAIQMKNFIYILVDRTKNIGVAVDACWDVDGIYKHAKDVIGVNLIGSIYTHFHLDHAGNLRIPGLKDILSKGGTTWIGENDYERAVKGNFQGSKIGND